MISTATKTLQANNKMIYIALLSTLTFFLFLDYIPGLEAWSAWVTPPNYSYTVTMSFPKGDNAKDANLKCCNPKGIPIMVMHNIAPNTKCDRQIQMPPRNIHRIFINI